MDFKLSPEQERFRVELRGWLEVNSPGDWGKIRAGLKTREAQAEFLVGWHRKLHGAGYVGLHWPTAYGGRGATVLEQAIFYEEFAHPPVDPTPAFVPLHGVELDGIPCEQEARTVGQDNVVTLDDLPLQLAKQPGRRTCAGLRVTVRRDVHGILSVWHGARCFGRCDSHGRPLALDRPKNARAHVPQQRPSIAPPTRRLPRPKRPSGPRLPTGCRD